MALSPEPNPAPLEAPSSYDSDKGDDDILSILQSNPPQTATRASPLKSSALGMAFELASKQANIAPNPQPSHDSESHVKVFLRLRPISNEESSCIEVNEDGCSVRATAPSPLNEKKEFKDARDYAFTKVMDENASQSDVYQSAAGDIVNSFCSEGKSGLIFTFGVTNAGKSYTVLGNQSNPGLLPRSLEKVCASLNTDDKDMLSVSYMEIYNEQIYDLLETTSDQPQVTRSSSFNSGFSGFSTGASGSFSEKPRKNLAIRDRGGKVVVEGLSRHVVNTAEEAMSLIETGSKERQTCSHNLNADSSRSHSVCSIELIRKGGLMTEEELNQQVPAVLWLVDLAGSERGERTGAGGQSKKQTEANSINTSLFTLMACLGTLRESSGGGKRGSMAMSKLRYRESKLTRLLGPHLSGKSLGPGGAGGTCMIVNANPRASDFVETCYVMSTTAPCTKIKIKQSKSSHSQSLLAAAAKFDENGRRIMKNAARMGMSTKQASSMGQHKKRSMINDNSVPNRRARLESQESTDSISAFDIDEFNALKAENKQLKAELREAREEADTIEAQVREECAEYMDQAMNFKKPNFLTSVNEDASDEDGERNAPTDFLQSARKKKKQESLQKVIDDLQDRCDDLEDELSRCTAENTTLVRSLALARGECDAQKVGEVPERWVMLDFLTQLLMAPDTIHKDVFQHEASALQAALRSVSFSSPMRRCADFDQFDSNSENKIEQVGFAIRNALQMGSESTTGLDSEVVKQFQEEPIAPIDDESEDKVVSSQENDVTIDQVQVEDDTPACESEIAVNPLLPLEEITEESEKENIESVIPPPKVITQLATIDPNSPPKEKQQKKKGSSKGEKYSPSVIGQMSQRIREKAGKKNNKKLPTTSPRRTRSSTLPLRV